MRKYETVVALHPDLTEAEVQKFAQDFQKTLESKGALDVKVDLWGKRQLAFNVEKKSHASYVCFYYSSEQANVVNEASAQLRLLEQVLLFQSHRLDLPIRAVKPGSSGSQEEYML
jgi:small subunit ribosomal protein S6